MQKVDALMIGNELNGAGVKDGTLPASKLKTDTDADKIQLENLSDEVRANMSGQAAVTANTAAATADQAAADALDAAALAESKAALADEKAAYAVTKADLAQTAKDHADQKAALAQTQADYAKTQGDYGKAQGDYAKAQGDLAKGVVAGVIPNATQTASGLLSPADKTAVDNGQKWRLTENTGRGVIPATGTHFDSIVDTGVYRYLVTSNHQGEPINNIGYWNVEVITYDSTTTTQRWTSPITNQVYVRTRFGTGAWGNFRRLTDDVYVANMALGNKIAVQAVANFVGKVSGSTTANPHIGGRRTVSTLGNPTLVAEWVEYGDAGGNSYGRILALDGTTSSTIGIGTGVLAQEKFSFNLIAHVERIYGAIPGTTTAEKVTWLKSAVTKLTFNWHGFGSSPAGNRAQIRMWAFGTWQGAVNSVAASTTKLSLPVTSVSYIDNDGFVHGLAHAEASDGTTSSTITTDYAELQIELAIDLKSNLLLNGVQGHKLTNDDGKAFVLPNGTDFNTVLKPGSYAFQQELGYTGKPPNSDVRYWQVQVDPFLTSIVQTWTSMESNKVEKYFRRFTTTGWSDYRKVIDSASLISSQLGNSVTDQSNANFIGKIHGSTVVNPHIFKRWNTATSPLSPVLFGAEPAQIEYDNVNKLDGSISTISTTTSGNIAQMLFSFNLLAHVERLYGTIPANDTAGKIAWLRSNVKSLVSNWHGYGTSPLGNKATYVVWHASGAVWHSFKPATTSATTAKIIYAITSSLNLFIGDDGFIHFLAYSEASDGTTASTINSDYVELVVDLSTNARTNLLAQGFQGHKLTTDTGTAITPPNGTDFNALTDTGYYVYSNDNAHKGSPNGYLYWLVEVTKYSSTLSVQTWKGIVHDEVYMRRTVTGGWSPFRKNVDENALTNVMMGNKPKHTTVLNFVSKLTGSTTANPHIMKIAASNAFVPPSTFITEATQDRYNISSALDGTTWLTSNAASSAMIQVCMSFNLLEFVQRTYGTIPGTTTADKVSWLKTNISRLTFYWDGFGSDPTGNKAAIKQFSVTANLWSAFESSHTLNRVSRLTYMRENSIADHIDANGFTHFLAYALPSDGVVASVLNTDYLELQVDLSTDLKTNLLLNGIQGHKLTQDNGRLTILSGASINLNDYLDSGFYYVQQSVLNLPVVSAGYVEISRADTSFVRQRFSISLNSKLRVYERFYVNAVWSEWLKVTDDRSLISALMGNLLSEQTTMNFVGKVAGSTTANPHTIIRFGGSTLTEPRLINPVDSFGKIEALQSYYDRLMSLNGVTNQNDRSEPNNQAQEMFSFNLIAYIERLYGTIPAMDNVGKVAWLKSNITKFTATWYGYGSGPTGNRASLTRWDANAGAWLSTAVTGTVHTSASVTPLTFTPSVASSIDANGFVHLLAYADPSNGTTPSMIITDYVEVKVDFDTSLKKNLAPIWIDAALQNGWVEFEAGQKPQYSLGADGFVTLKGAVKSGTFGSSTPAYYLPSGMRPPRTVYLFATGVVGNVYRVIINSTGNVYIEQSVGTNGNAFVSLDGIRFPIN